MTGSVDGPEGAAGYFRQRGLERVVARARETFWRNGRAAGQIVLDNATEEEHGGIGGLSGRPVGHGPLRVKLIDLDRWLRQSRYACSLEEALTAYYRERLSSRSEERDWARQKATQTRDRWQRMLDTIAEDLPIDDGGRRWLTEGAHGIPWLVRRFQREPEASMPEKGAQVRIVATGLSRLPLAEPKRLAVFANELAGNPHALDPNQEAGRLLTQGLLDLYGAEVRSHEAEIAGSVGDRLTAAARRVLYEYVGLPGETISSTVAVYNLMSATRHDGSLDSAVTGQPRILVLALRNLMEWSGVRPSLPDVFIVENPVVFEDLVDGLEPWPPRPTLICTSGWLNVASWRLLDLLAGFGDVAHFWYSGDFDLAGLRIAGSLRKRYPDRFRPWRLAAEDYRVADRDQGPSVSAEELRQLANLSSEFPDLAQAMQETGRWAYQEAITPLLLEDLRGASHSNK